MYIKTCPGGNIWIMPRSIHRDVIYSSELYHGSISTWFKFGVCPSLMMFCLYGSSMSMRRFDYSRLSSLHCMTCQKVIYDNHLELVTVLVDKPQITPDKFQKVYRKARAFILHTQVPLCQSNISYVNICLSSISSSVSRHFLHGPLLLTLTSSSTLFTVRSLEIHHYTNHCWHPRLA